MKSLAIVALALTAVACDERPAAAPTQKEREAALEERARLTGAVVVEALRRFKDGGSRGELARALSGVAEKTTPGGLSATYMLECLRAKPAYDVPPVTEIDTLVRSRIDALVEETCAPAGDAPLEYSGSHDPRGVEALVGLGFTALDALEGSTKDRRLTRCVGFAAIDSDSMSICSIDPPACPSGPGPRIPSVTTVGELVRSVLYQLRRGKKQIDRSDVECDLRAGGDRALDDMMTTAIASQDWPRAFTLAKRAAGSARRRMVDAIATKVPASDARAFLVEEATEGPVLAARMRAIERLRDAKDPRWPALMASTIDSALAKEDDDHPRCDRELVAWQLRSLLDKFPKEAAIGLSKSFASYSPRSTKEVVYRILTTSSPLTAEGAALAAKALKDTRSTHSDSHTNEYRCIGVTPSDVVALHVGPRVGVPYSCELSAEEKAKAVEAILSKRGKVAGW